MDDDVLSGTIELARRLGRRDGEHLVVVVRDEHGQVATAKLGKVRAAAFIEMCARAAEMLFQLEDG